MTANTLVQRTVIVKQPTTAPIVIDRSLQATIALNRAQTTVQRPLSPAQVVEQPIVVVNGNPAGVQGPQGIPGSAAGSIAPINFSFGDAPHTVYVAPNNGLVTIARVVVTTPFNGAGSALKLGTAPAPEAAFPAAFSDLSVLSEYENSPDLQLTAGDHLILTITPGAGATQGAGYLLLTFIND